MYLPQVTTQFPTLASEICKKIPGITIFTYRKKKKPKQQSISQALVTLLGEWLLERIDG